MISIMLPASPGHRCSAFYDTQWVAQFHQSHHVRVTSIALQVRHDSHIETSRDAMPPEKVKRIFT